MLLSTLSLIGIKVKRVSKYSVVKVNFQYCGQSSCIEPAQLSFSQDDLVLTQTVVIQSSGRPKVFIYNLPFKF